MEEYLFGIAFYTVIGILIYRRIKKKNKTPKDIPVRKVEETKNWVYDPQNKRFVEKQQNETADHDFKTVQNVQNNGEYHHAYKRSSAGEYHYQYKKSDKINEQPKQQYKAKQKYNENNIYKEQPQEHNKPVVNEQSGNYYAKSLLTARELQAYAKLKPIADRRNLVICPKVRLADIVHPYNNDPKFMSHFGRIKSKHVDFVICDPWMEIVGIIELDDRTHDREDRKQRDKLVDDILTSVGYKIVHTREITPDILDQFLNQ